jgi:hypothetical protein
MIPELHSPNESSFKSPYKSPVKHGANFSLNLGQNNISSHSINSMIDLNTKRSSRRRSTEEGIVKNAKCAKHNSHTYNSKYQTEDSSTLYEERKMTIGKPRYSVNVPKLQTHNIHDNVGLEHNNSGSMTTQHQYNKTYDMRENKNRYSTQPHVNYRQHVGGIGFINKTVPCKLFYLYLVLKLFLV